MPYIDSITVGGVQYDIAAGGVAPGANIESPNLTGVPVAPTAAPRTNTAQIATTAFVQTAVSSAGGLPEVTTADNGKVLMVVSGAWAAADLPVYTGVVE